MRSDVHVAHNRVVCCVVDILDHVANERAQRKRIGQYRLFEFHGALTFPLVRRLQRFVRDLRVHIGLFGLRELFGMEPCIEIVENIVWSGPTCAVNEFALHPVIKRLEQFEAFAGVRLRQERRVRFDRCETGHREQCVRIKVPPECKISFI